MPNDGKNSITKTTISSFPVRHKVGNVGIFVLLKFRNKLDAVIHHFNFHPKHHDKCKVVLN